MKYMQCGACRNTVEINSTGVCLGCQRGFVGIPQEDAFKVGKKVKTLAKPKAKDVLKDLKDRQKEIEDALD